MPIQDFPVTLTELIDRGWVEVHPAVDISLNDGTILHWSSVPITVEGVTYEDKLKQVNTVKDSLSRSVDRTEITLDNADLAVGDALNDDSVDNLLDNLPAEYHQIYVNIADRTEQYKITRMVGVVYTFTEDGADELNLTIISDAYAGKGVAPYGVKQNCVWQYKDGINCDYVGNIPTCDLTFSGSNGCVAHFGFDMAKARYGGGALDLSETARRNFDIINDRDGRIPVGNCFFGATPIYTDEDYAAKMIREFKAEDDLLGHHPSDLLPRQDKADRDVFKYLLREWYFLVFSDGAVLNVTGSHPFYPEPGKRVEVKDFEEGMKFRRNVNGKWRTVSLVRKQHMKSNVPTPFYNVPARETHHYYANGFPVSNLKRQVGLDYPTGWYPYDPF